MNEYADIIRELRQEIADIKKEKDEIDEKLKYERIDNLEERLLIANNLIEKLSDDLKNAHEIIVKMAEQLTK